MDADFYPVRDVLENIELHDDTPLLVDVGGGIGPDAIEFRSKHPSVPGRLIVQDLPGAIPPTLLQDRGIEFMSHDFFTPQPIKGYQSETVFINARMTDCF